MHPGFLRQITRLFIAGWAKAVAYRADIFAYTLVSIAAPVVALAVWYSVAQSGGLGGNPRNILTYYILIMFVELITRAWRGIYIVGKIRDGKIVEQIVRPPIVLWENVTSNITTKLVQVTFPILLFVSAAIIFPTWFSPEMYKLENLLPFLLSLSLAVVIWFLLDIAIGLTAFWLEEAFELHTYRFLFMQIASGILIPFSAMPELLRQIFSFLPFRYVISAPVEILLNQTVNTSTLQLLAVQAFWVLVFIVLVRTLFVKGLRRYEIPG